MNALRAMTERQAVVLALALRDGAYPEWEPVGWCRSPFAPDDQRLVVVRHRPTGVVLHIGDPQWIAVADPRVVLRLALPHLSPRDRLSVSAWLAGAAHVAPADPAEQ